MWIRTAAFALTLTAVLNAAGSASVTMTTLSSRPEFVSGGDALIEVKAAAGTALTQVALTLNGKDVSSQIAHDTTTGTYRGVVSGLVVGQNKLVATVKAPFKGEATLTVTNYPAAGPILSGTHLTPFECNTEQSGLGKATDADCSAPRKIWYLYRASDNTFKPLDNPTGPRPADLVQTTTNDGKTVPYIVRVDSGVVNRAIYQLAILDDPTPATVNADAYKPSAGWNRKLMVSFGGSSGTQYIQGAEPSPVAAVAAGARAGGGSRVMNHAALSKGFAFLISSELVNGRRGNAVLQGETLMMLKEYFIEHYGVPKWTVGQGGSGGAIQQLVITEMYPGLLDGLMPSLSFPDSSLHTNDSILLTTVWPKLDSTVWTQAKKTAVEGFTPGTAAAWTNAYGRLGVPSNARGCALTDLSLIYDPIKNLKGARCTTQDIRANIYGRDPKTGFALRPTDNVGLQYGLAALNSGTISVDEFLDLNEKVGGTDLEGAFVPQRMAGDRQALKAAYESGLNASYNAGLGNVPIMMARTYNDARGDIHSRERDFVIRARLQKANGRVDNTSVWIGADQRALGTTEAMNQWLDGMAADPAPLSIDKVVKHKPTEAVDTCWDAQGAKIVEPASFDNPNTKCNTLYPVHSEPRLVAGAPLTDDVLKCAVKPVNFADYKVTFTSAQKDRMKTVFPTAVCDFSKPGVEQVPIKGTYQRY
jgi:Tannase-like family of unknown function (DUF6351)